MKKVLTIAGSDSGGGAGIQADLKTFSALGVFGMTAITALTAQNSTGVQGIYEINPIFIGQQIDSVMSDIGADVWKTGMLANEEIIKIVADRARKYNVKLLVIDPVMVAKSGDHLLKPEANKALILNLIPLAYVITPNHYEAQVITDMEISNLIEARKAAKKIKSLGAQNVVIKGGHLPDVDNAIDLLYDGKIFTEFHSRRIDSKNTHGTGCTFASAIAAELAKGQKVKDAVHIAKAYLTTAIIKAEKLKFGKGYGPTNHTLDYSAKVDLELVSIKED